MGVIAGFLELKFLDVFGASMIMMHVQFMACKPSKIIASLFSSCCMLLRQRSNWPSSSSTFASSALTDPCVGRPLAAGYPLVIQQFANWKPWPMFR